MVQFFLKFEVGNPLKRLVEKMYQEEKCERSFRSTSRWNFFTKFGMVTTCGMNLNIQESNLKISSSSYYSSSFLCKKMNFLTNFGSWRSRNDTKRLILIWGMLSYIFVSWNNPFQISSSSSKYKKKVWHHLKSFKNLPLYFRVSRFI